MDWQGRYESGDTPWDKGLAAPSLDQLFKEFPNLFSSGKEVLVPGCGLGHDVVAIAEQSNSVAGVDIAPIAVQMAAENNSANKRAHFCVADLFDLPAEMIEAFDVVWEHTCFCALDPSLRADYVEVMWRALRPAGVLAGIFFINPDVEEGEGPPFGAEREEIHELFGSRFTLEWEAEPQFFYEGREGRERLMVFRRLG